MTRGNAIATDSISRHMTESPHCIAGHRSLSDAWAMMREHRVRHLPVLEGGEIVGMISERDLGLLGTKAPERLEDVQVGEAMSGVPYCVAPDAPLREVIEQMASRKLGAAIVAEHGKVRGVFTTVDALKLLRGLLSET